MKEKEEAAKRLLAEIGKSLLCLLCVVLGYLAMTTESFLLSIVGLFFLVGGFWGFWSVREKVRAAYVHFYEVGGHPYRTSVLLLIPGLLLSLNATKGLEANVSLSSIGYLGGIVGVGLFILGVTLFGRPSPHDIL